MTHTIGGATRKAIHWWVVRPLAVLWCLSAVMLALAVQDRVYLVADLVVLAFVAIGGGLVTIQRELATVHLLVNSQHDDLVMRVAELTEALEAQGIPVPPLRSHRRKVYS